MEMKYRVSINTWGSPNAKETSVYHYEYSSIDDAYSFAYKEKERLAKDALQHSEHCYSIEIWEYNNNGYTLYDRV